MNLSLIKKTAVLTILLRFLGGTHPLINKNMSSTENTSDFFNMLYEGSKLALQFKGRQMAPVAAVVSKNNDPEGKRRVKVYDPTKGAKVESDWIKPLRIMPQSDPPLPRVNDTVILIFLNGDPDDGLYLPLINDTNSPLDKSDPVNDHADVVPGNKYKQVKGNEESTIEGYFNRSIKGELTELIEKNYSINSLKQILMESVAELSLVSQLKATLAASGASITLAGGVITWSWGGTTPKTMVMNSDGTVTWNMAGNNITFAMGGGTVTFNMNGGALNITNASAFTVNGAAVASVGAKDTRLDTITTQGWTASPAYVPPTP